MLLVVMHAVTSDLVGRWTFEVGSWMLDVLIHVPTSDLLRNGHL